MIVYRLRYKNPRTFPWMSEDQKQFFQRDGSTANITHVYLTREAAVRAQASVYYTETEVVAFRLEEA